MAALRAAAANPVHAYLFRGPAGHGGLAAAYGFAAALLCPDGRLRRVRHLPGRPWPAPTPTSTSCGAPGPPSRIGRAPPGRALAQRRPLQAAAPGDRGADVHLAALRRPGAAQDPRGATGRHRLRPAGRRRAPRAGHGGQPVRRDPLPAGAPAVAGALADRVGRAARHGRGGGRQQRRQPRAGPGHGRRPRRGGPGRAVGFGARRADRRRARRPPAWPDGCSTRPTGRSSRCGRPTHGSSRR